MKQIWQFKYCVTHSTFLLLTRLENYFIDFQKISLLSYPLILLLALSHTHKDTHTSLIAPPPLPPSILSLLFFLPFFPTDQTEL